MSFFALGLYQLENLLIARPTFRFIDARMQPQLVSIPRVQAVLAHAKVVSAHQVAAHLKSESAGVDEPIVLLCEDARLSTSLALQLEQLGFRQIYIVEDGLDGLLREAIASS